MIESCDINLLFHAFDAGSPFHTQARSYLQGQADNADFVLCELVLCELYPLLRRSEIWSSPMTAEQAARTIQALRSNKTWRVVDYPGGLMSVVWNRASRTQFPRSGVFDARLALTLRYHGVKRFATRNVKHFQDYGFDEVFDPIVS